MQQALIDVATRQQVLLERLKASEVKKITPFLKRIDADLRDQLTAADITSYSKSRVERLIKGVDVMLAGVLDDYKSDVMGSLDDIAVHAAEIEGKTLDSITTSNFETVIPSAEQVIAAIRTSPLSVRGPDGGKLLDPFISDWTKAERSAVTGAIRQGFFEGQTTDQIIRKIRGTASNQFKDGLLQITKNHAQAVVQTAIQHAASTARLETLKANTDIANQYQWVSTLDGRTTQQCRSLDGQKFSYGQGPVPPIHIRCRSTIVPVLNDEFAWLSKDATRASKDGYVSQDETYYDWLKRQPAEFQDAAIGKTRAKLFRDGGLSPEEFAKLNLGKNFAPLTLDEMRQLNGEVFMRAFGNNGPQIPTANPPEVSAAQLLTRPPNYAILDEKTKDYIDRGFVNSAYSGLVGRYPAPVLQYTGKSAYYQRSATTINMHKDPKNWSGQVETFTHEYGHFLDSMVAKDRGGIWWSAKPENGFIDAQKSDIKDLKKSLDAYHKGALNRHPQLSASGHVSYAYEQDFYASVKEMGALGFPEKMLRFLRAEAQDDSLVKAILASAPDSALLAMTQRSFGALLTVARHEDAFLMAFADGASYSIGGLGGFNSEHRMAFKLVSTVADLIGSSTKNRWGWGHTKSYYKQSENMQLESFAQVFLLENSAPEWKAFAQKAFPAMFKAVRGLANEFDR